MGLISNGTTIFDAGSMSAGLGGSMVFIKKLTASASATLSFVDGSASVVLDNTYKEYLFTFNNIHGATDDKKFMFQATAAGGSGYNETITTSNFQCYNREDGGALGLSYNTGYDNAQTTDFQEISGPLSNDNDAGFSGYLQIFNPSDTTFVKHFRAVGNGMEAGTSKVATILYTGGYFNTTSAIDEFQFKMQSGNIDSGDICLYGIS